MRTLSLIAAASAAMALTACASTGAEKATSSGAYASELAKLQAQCDARKGMLIPTGRLSGAQPQLDYTCDIRSGGNRVP